MRIVYVTSISLAEQTGAREHILEMVRGLEKLGHGVRLISPTGFVRGVPAAVQRKLALARLVRQGIEDFEPHLAYFRYGAGDVLAFRQISKAGLPCVVELNSKHRQEIRLGKRWLPYFISLATDRWMFAIAAGIASVTNEMYEHAIARNGVNKPFLLAKNGVNVESFALGYNPDLRKQYQTPGNAPVLAFIGLMAQWQGLDILFKALAEPELKEFYLWLIGSDDHGRFRHLIPNKEVLGRLRFIPWQPVSTLAEILSAVDVGIGALAIDRKGMEETQTLKLRTYLAAGVPSLLGHKDPVIPPDLEFVSPGRVTTAEELAVEILTFHQRVMVDRVRMGDEARKFAESHLSWQRAAAETAEFLEEIYEAHCGR